MHSVWVDADPGFDDWLALLLLAQAAPQVQISGVSVVAGNAPLGVVLNNTLALRQLHQWTWPVYAGASKPLVAQPIDAGYVLGPSGMRTTGAELPKPDPTAKAQPAHAVSALLDWLCAPAAPGRRSLLATGPLTNIAGAIQQHRAAFEGLSEIVLMGGSTDRGNHTPAAEFNIAADPEAAAVVFSSGVPVRMVGLNVCRQVLLHAADVQRLQALMKPSTAGQMLVGYLDGYQRIRSAEGDLPMPLYDPVAALALLQPALFNWQMAPVDVELQGQFTRGMTVVDLRNRAGRPIAVRVAVGVDGSAVLAVVLQSIAAVAQPS